ncbi:rod shape-determining protein MreD [Robertmurraya andreesenii]|uniref:Rod shape-determining protein MreD n=1 Tax=Anoxybacillus andreesenii TaxID=1325932 RepID=A0ABT9V592_9BACL|nr:rod shape-determining protein MreD [Robertmurraya andreesenii]MDQ0156113.1 rod shape-determining protein MreD [Robertmurraya andreesenii]
MKKFLLPLLFIFIFIFESIFVQSLPAEVFHGERILVPHFLIIAILFLTLYGDSKQGILYGLSFGLLFDVVYTEVLGIYLFLFPLIAYICAKIMRILQTNIVVVSIISLLGVALLELGVYEMNFLINKTDMSFSFYAQYRLLPTLILNLTFIILFSYPLKRLSEKYVAYLNKEK